MKPIILIAPPQAGKGTLAKVLVNQYNLPHISTGDLLREEIATDSLLGKELKEIMKNGYLIEDNIVTNLLKERLLKEDCNNGFILDGYPRNLDQAKTYVSLIKELKKELGTVISLDISLETAIKRVMGRVVCKNCGATFNILLSGAHPREENICDLCHGPLIKRDDDNEEALMNRFDIFHNQTKPILDYFSSITHVYHVNSENKDNTLKEVKLILEKEENYD